MEEFDISTEIKRFANHIEPDFNKYILFSGIFGIGKTYFLRRFFQQKPGYLSIRISPVNYAVAQNEDIFEYIKYDIVYELLKKYPKQEDLPDVNTNMYWQVYLLNHYKEIFWDIAQNSSKIDKRFEAIFNAVKTLRNHLKQAKKLTEQNDQKQLEDFFSEIEKKPGTIFENNYVTQIIRGIVEDFRISDNEKKVVLIIDDLDRIDPEHIFRILNVFSVHNDYDQGESHKFGFDKVIIVCDVQNVRNIFHSKYGGDTDFNGYLDKFYSSEIFHYSIKKVVAKSIYSFLLQIKSTDSDIQSWFYTRSEFARLLSEILTAFFLADAINIRALVNFLGTEYEVEERFVEIGRKTYNSSVPSLFLFDLLERLCGGELQLKTALKKTKICFNLVVMDGWQYAYGLLALILDVDNNKLNPKDELFYRNNDLNTDIIYKVESHGYGVIGTAAIVKGTTQNFERTNPDFQNYGRLLMREYNPFFELLQQAYYKKLSLK
ncbi:P-loop NTPase fold protein [Salinimicrobium sp. CAU 1759]